MKIVRTFPWRFSSTLQHMTLGISYRMARNTTCSISCLHCRSTQRYHQSGSHLRMSWAKTQLEYYLRIHVCQSQKSSGATWTAWWGVTDTKSELSLKSQARSGMHWLKSSSQWFRSCGTTYLCSIVGTSNSVVQLWCRFVHGCSTTG